MACLSVGSSMEQRGIEGQFPAARWDSGVSELHAHKMRHTVACPWLERGRGHAARQQMLGHSSIVTTQRYARISDDLVRREVERLEYAAGGRS